VENEPQLNHIYLLQKISSAKNIDLTTWIIRRQ
jgi:hypothetical protein